MLLVALVIAGLLVAIALARKPHGQRVRVGFFVERETPPEGGVESRDTDGR